MNIVRESKQLDKDAAIIINQAQTIFGEEQSLVVSTLVREHLERVFIQFGKSEVDLRRAVADYKRFHKEARHQNNQKELSAMTLVIIYLKARIIGDRATCASERIKLYADSSQG